MGTFYIFGSGLISGDVSLKGLQVLRSSEYILAENVNKAKNIVSELGLDENSYTFIPYETYMSDGMIDYTNSEDIMKTLRSGKNVVYLANVGMPKTDQPRGNIVTRILCEDDLIVKVVGSSDYPSTIMSVSGLGQGDGFLYKDIRGDGVDFINILMPIAKELFAATIFLLNEKDLSTKIDAIRKHVGDKSHAAIVHRIDTDSPGVVGGNLEYILHHISQYPQLFVTGPFGLVIGGKKKDISPSEGSKNSIQSLHDWPKGYIER